jgi:putative ABC transport system substrate-binding protein
MVTWLAATVALLLLATPLTAWAQQQVARVPRIGVLISTPMTAAFQEGFRQGLRDHGYVEGQNILVEWRASEGRPDRAEALARDLVRLKVDVIVAMLTPAVQAAKNATSTIPIVMSRLEIP